jgi:hypothetical protein
MVRCAKAAMYAAGAEICGTSDLSFVADLTSSCYER